MAVEEASRTGQVAEPAAVTLARVVRDLTQDELSIRSNVSQGFLSKVERGVVDLSDDRLVRVAGALDFPVEFFFVDPWAQVPQTACAFPRKRNSLPTSVERRARALLQLTRMQVELLVGEVAPAVTLERLHPSDADWISPTEMAAAVRVAAGVPSGPIPNLTQFLEGLGVLVVARDLGNRRLDALGQWPDGGRPLMLVNTTAPTDRRRFTGAHELGHAVLHTTPTATQEDEADEFAAELLMPAEDGHQVLNNLNLATLTELKRAWGMSIAALIRRARDLGKINDYRYRQLNIELSASGYRMNEPGQLTPEPPTAIATLLQRLIDQGRSIADLAASARLLEHEFRDLYLEAV